MQLNEYQIVALIELETKRIAPNADAIIELANELKAARQREREQKPSLAA